MSVAAPVARFFWPLERKLPLLIAALLCAVGGAFGWLAHEELEHAFEAAAADRLVAAAHRMSALLVESATSVRKEGAAFARDPGIASLLTDAAAGARDSTLDVLSGLQPEATRGASRALWTRDCRRITASGSLANSPALTICPSRASGAPHLYGLQPFTAWGDSVMYVFVQPVVRASDTLGFYVQSRAVGGGSSARVLTGLLGKDASLIVGNASGGAVWSNLARRVDGPSAAARRGVVEHYLPNGGEQQLGVMLDVPSTPWVAWAQMPLSTAMGGLYVPLWRVGILALLCIIVGAFCAWLLSRHVTAPIAELARAEEDFAGGNYARRVTTTRRDELGRLMASFNQMAERVQAASRERQSAQSLLDEVLSQAPVGIAVLDGRLRFARVNQAFAAISGHPSEQHLGRHVSDMMPSMAPTAQSHLEGVLATGRAVTNQLSRGSEGEGSARYWRGSYFPVRGPAGEVTGAGAILVDTTAHVELEAQFLHAQKMDAVGRLAGGVAHDFNNLLTVISSYSEMALQSLEPQNELYGDMQEIHNAADRAARLTTQLLAFSRKQVMTPVILDLNRVAADMERMLRRLIGEDIALVLETGAELGCIRADAGQLGQVIMNLALNARDAMPNGGRLVVRTAAANVAADFVSDSVTVRAGAYVTLSVSDTGTGMSDETLAHLFEPFYTTKGSGLGTGLGLSTAYGIIKQSGGEITVKSVLDQGSTFVAYLPRVSDATG